MRHAPAGYSLVDLLVALAVGGGLMASTLTLLHLGLRAWVWGAARVDAQQSARYAVERMASELREAGYDPTVAGIAPVVLAEPARVVFQRDFNGNGVVDPTRERVTYLDRAGAETTDAAAVTAVRIRLEVGEPGSAVIVETQATLRNLLW